MVILFHSGEYRCFRFLPGLVFGGSRCISHFRSQHSGCNKDMHACRYREAADGGYRRLRALIVDMLAVDARDRPSALRVAQSLNQLIADFQSML